MRTFAEFLETKIRGVDFRPGYMPSASVFRPSGPEKINPFSAVSPSRPYQPLFRAGKSQIKSQIMGKKH